MNRLNKIYLKRQDEYLHPSVVSANPIDEALKDELVSEAVHSIGTLPFSAAARRNLSINNYHSNKVEFLFVGELNAKESYSP